VTDRAASLTRLARLLVLTDCSRCADLRGTVAVAARHGARAVVLREKDLPPPERARLAADLRAVLAPFGGVLILAGTHAGDAVHLAARDPMPHPRPALVGRSCHDADEVRAATAEGCDYITVSPVFPTPSKPGYGPALGLGGLADLVGGTGRAGPAVYALGGVRPQDVAGCLAAGARGIAVMGPANRDPRIVADYLESLRAARAIETQCAPRALEAQCAAEQENA
jgi:thiamine monophosphate synthase